jgi:alpha-aminoadipate/glutamate carrier protein LysW
MARWNSRSLRNFDHVVCPECQNDFDLQEETVTEGEIVSCNNCGSGFEVMTNPFELRRIEDFNPSPRTDRTAA